MTVNKAVTRCLRTCAWKLSPVGGGEAGENSAEFLRTSCRGAIPFSLLAAHRTTHYSYRDLPCPSVSGPRPFSVLSHLPRLLPSAFNLADVAFELRSYCPTLEETSPPWLYP